MSMEYMTCGTVEGPRTLHGNSSRRLKPALYISMTLWE